jgi:hypothetical protein
MTNGVFRPFAMVKKSDGQPAVEVDNDGKRQQFASYSQMYCEFRLLILFIVRGRVVVNGPGENA